MRFVETPLFGAYVIEPETITDERGAFARMFDRKVFVDHGLFGDFAQASLSFNSKKGTLRGLHFQVPQAETKLVRCVRGAVWDVMVDVQKHSTSYKKWHAVELDADSRRAVYIPAGFAHGFLTLTDATELHYQITPAHDPFGGRGIRWDDPELAIEWPFRPTVMSERDRTLPLLSELPHA